MLMQTLAICVTVGAAAVLVGGPALAAEAADGGRLLYVAGRAGGKDAGIYRGRLDGATGRLTVAGRAAEAAQPSFLALHPGGRVLYLANAVRAFRGQKGGSVDAYRIHRGTGALTLLNRRPSGGTSTCHLTVDPSGRCLLAVNYGTGSVVAFPVAEDGRLGEATAFIQHRGKSVHPRRQRGPHAHSVNVAPSGRFAFVADLGLDRVLVYRLDAAAGTLAPHAPPFAAVEPGSGPRHLALHPHGRFAYVVNELTSSVTAFRYDAEGGVLEPVHTAGALPDGFEGQNTGAEVAVHPSGRFLYSSNRGHDSIAVFAIDEGTGRLRPVGHVPTGGKRPRHFALDPSGRYLLAANRDSDTVVVFRIDAKTGLPAPAGHAAEVPGPVCVRMVP